MLKKLIIYLSIIVIVILGLKNSLYAIYEIGIGISAGLTYDMNNLEHEIGTHKFFHPF